MSQPILDRTVLLNIVQQVREPGTGPDLDGLLFSTTNPKLRGRDASLARVIYDFFKSNVRLSSYKFATNETNLAGRAVDLESLAAWTASLVGVGADPAKAIDAVIAFIENGEAKAVTYLVLGGLWSVKGTLLPPDMELKRFEDFQPSATATEIFDHPLVKAFADLTNPVASSPFSIGWKACP